MKFLDTIKQVAAAMRKLIADKEDTTQVFIILQALAGNSGVRAYKRFLQSPDAEAILCADKVLIEWLRDRDWLAAQPSGSLACAYHQFTERENITADGLVAASETGGRDYETLSPRQRIYQTRQRDAHDLWHVITGYGRDSLGELALLAVTWRQSGNIGLLLIIAFGWRETRKAAPHVKIWPVLREGFRRGKKGGNLPAAHWESLLSRPLDAVREELGFAAPPTAYRAFLKANDDAPESHDPENADTKIAAE